MPDLDAIPGVRELWQLTLGEPSVRLALIDGPADLSHPCFAGADIDVLEPWWLPQEVKEGAPGAISSRLEHGTWVSSVLFGDHASAVPGLAPRCKGLLVPALRGDLNELEPVCLAHAVDLAADAGAGVVVLEVCLPTPSCDVDDILKRSLRAAARSGVLLVAGSGNEASERSCFPAASPDVLAVGAYDDDGRVYSFSNSGPEYEGHGLVAPGGNLTGAIPGGGTKVHRGTSCSGPVAGGIAALLVSLQVARGAPPDPIAVGHALVETAARCSERDTDGGPERCIAGRLDVPAATDLVLAELGERRRRPAARRAAGRAQRGGSVAAASAKRDRPHADALPPPAAMTSAEPERPLPAGLLVFALGALRYDLETETRRDAFARLLADGVVEDERAVARHLAAHPEDAAALTWVLAIDGAPAYAVEPGGPYAASIHRQLVRLLTGQLALESHERVERISLPGRLTERRIELLSGELVAVVEVEGLRGLHGLNVAALAAAAAQHVPPGKDAEALRTALAEFLMRVHVDMANLGCTSPQRALNFAATNAYQAAASLAAGLARGMVLETIDTQRSAVCRLDSDCWDVRLRFFDPENGRRARTLVRFTIDVSDVMPVTLGDIQLWSESAAARAA